MKKILIIRFSSIGDIVLTTPVIRAVKSQLDCTLHMLTKTAFAGIVKNNPHVDKVYSFTASVREVIQGLQSENYDFIIDLQKNIRSVITRKALGVPSSSFPKLNMEKWMLVNMKVNRMPDLHVVDRYFAAAEPLGISPDGEGLDYFIPEADQVIPEKAHPMLQGGYVGVVIGGKHNTKILPGEKVAEIIKALNYPVVLLGGEADRERGNRITKLSNHEKVFNACGKFNLNQSASLVKQARVIISNDTGLMHIAAAFRKPVISIWGNTTPVFGMYPFMPAEEDLSVISEVKGLRCRPCSKLGYRQCPKKHFKCMMEQDTDYIVSQAKKFIT
ncbi:MAG: glycosyltransferase family 9 protein [bacterium]